MSYLTFAYLPVFGRYFSSRCSSRTSGPPVAQLIVVSCVPMATRIVSLAAATGAELLAAGASCFAWHANDERSESPSERVRARRVISFPDPRLRFAWRWFPRRGALLCGLRRLDPMRARATRGWPAEPGARRARRPRRAAD